MRRGEPAFPGVRRRAGRGEPRSPVDGEEVDLSPAAGGHVAPDFGWDEDTPAPTTARERQRIIKATEAFNASSPNRRRAQQVLAALHAVARAVCSWSITMVLGATLSFVLVRASSWGAFGETRAMPKIVDRVPAGGFGPLQIVANLSHAPGNVAVTRHGRVFFTFHPDNPTKPPGGVKVAEWLPTQGRWVPFPSAAAQRDLFVSPLSLRADRHDRLWVLDHANHAAVQRAKMVLLSLADGGVLETHEFDRWDAPRGTMLNDFQLDPEGRFAYIADSSIVRHTPGLVVFDSDHGVSWRVLTGHASMKLEKPLRASVAGHPVRLVGALDLKVNVDSIAVDRRGRWLYYGALTSGALYRVDTALLRNHSLSDAGRETQVQLVSVKPLSDGLTMDDGDNLYVTAIEESGLLRIDDVDARARAAVDRKRSLAGLTKVAQSDALLRWPDGLSFGPDRHLYVTCSALHEAFKPGAARRWAQLAPFHILRLALPDAEPDAPAGQ